MENGFCVCPWHDNRHVDDENKYANGGTMRTSVRGGLLLKSTLGPFFCPQTRETRNGAITLRLLFLSGYEGRKIVRPITRKRRALDNAPGIVVRTQRRGPRLRHAPTTIGLS